MTHDSNISNTQTWIQTNFLTSSFYQYHTLNHLTELTTSFHVFIARSSEAIRLDKDVVVAAASGPEAWMMLPQQCFADKAGAGGAGENAATLQSFG